MKHFKVDEIRLISQAMKEPDSIRPNFQGEKRVRLAELAKDIGCQPAATYAFVEMAKAALAAGRIAEAIQILENQLSENPFDIQLNFDLRGALSEANGKLQSLATVDPGNAEYGRAYDKAGEYGYLSLQSHLGAIRHYVCCSYNIPKAVQIAKSLLLVAPALPGLKLAIRELSLVSDDTFIQQQLLKMKETD